MIDEKLLKKEELVVYMLRSLYRRYGYAQYKMSKFEEYDLYVKNKDFLVSDRIITFNDTNGKLLALKPDVTLSIINHISEEPEGVQKMYYNENVYRVSGESHSFKEIVQTGLECVGNIALYEICEVVSLAVKSLEAIGENFKLDISHAGLLSSLLSSVGLEGETEKKVRECIYRKNSGEVSSMMEEGKISASQTALVNALMRNYKNPEELFDILESLCGDNEEMREFKAVCSALSSLGLFKNVNINFSLINDMSYYSGVVFKGYIEGAPSSVLSGGQYDKLMKKFKKKAGAIGFAVYLDSFERLNFEAPEYDADIVLIANGEKTEEIIKRAEELSMDGSRVLVQKKLPSDIRYRKALDMNGKELSENA